MHHSVYDAPPCGDDELRSRQLVNGAPIDESAIRGFELKLRQPMAVGHVMAERDRAYIGILSVDALTCEDPVALLLVVEDDGIRIELTANHTKACLLGYPVLSEPVSGGCVHVANHVIESRNTG